MLRAKCVQKARRPYWSDKISQLNVLILTSFSDNLDFIRILTAKASLSPSLLRWSLPRLRTALHWIMNWVRSWVRESEYILHVCSWIETIQEANPLCKFCELEERERERERETDPKLDQPVDAFELERSSFEEVIKSNLLKNKRNLKLEKRKSRIKFDWANLKWSSVIQFILNSS